MKYPVASAVLTSALVCAIPAWAQDAPQAEPATPASPGAPAVPAAPTPGATAPAMPSPLFDPALLKLYMDVLKDIKPLTDHHATLKQKVETARNFGFSADTKAELQASFGNDNPLHIAVEDLPGGGAVIHTHSDALDYTDPKGGATLHIEPITAESTVNRDYKAIKFSFALPGLKLTTSTDPKQVELSDISIWGENTVGPFNFFIGKSSGKVGRVRFGTPDVFLLDFNDMAVDANIAARNKMFDVSYDYRMASVDWGSDKLEDVHTDISLVNIDAQALEKLVEFSESVNDGGQLDDTRMQEVIKTLKGFAVDLSRHNGAIEIRDISARYHGQTAGLSGRITLPNLKQSDLDSMQKTYEKLAVRLKLHIPMAMVDDVSHRIAHAMMEAQAKQNGAEVTDVAVDLVARGMVGKITDMLIKQQKWAHMEKDEIATVFELKRGKMYLDGHSVNANSNPFLAMAQGK